MLDKQDVAMQTEEINLRIKRERLTRERFFEEEKRLKTLVSAWKLNTNISLILTFICE